MHASRVTCRTWCRVIAAPVAPDITAATTLSYNTNAVILLYAFMFIMPVLTCLSEWWMSTGGSGLSLQMRLWKFSSMGRCSRARAPLTSPLLCLKTSWQRSSSLQPRAHNSFTWEGEKENKKNCVRLYPQHWLGLFVFLRYCKMHHIDHTGCSKAVKHFFCLFGFFFFFTVARRPSAVLYAHSWLWFPHGVSEQWCFLENRLAVIPVKEQLKFHRLWLLLNVQRVK